MHRMSVEDFRESEKIPLTVVLDDVRSMYNIGSVFRTSDAFRVEEVLLCGITATPPHPEIHKTALGGEDSIDTLPVFSSQESQGAAIVFGNEVKGVHQEVIDNSDGCIEIPQYGTKHSLNVSVTAGIVIWEFARRMIQRL